MIDTTPTPEDIEQHEIAEGILVGLVRTLLDYPGSLDHEGAATALRMAGEERERQGDYRASVLLDEWAERLRCGHLRDSMKATLYEIVEKSALLSA